jgi:hypothetical protein
MATSLPSRVSQVLVLLAVAVAFAFATVASAASVIDDARGRTVDAEVVRITTNGPGRRWYDVRYVTTTGRVCESSVDSGSHPPSREISVGGRSSVHYSGSHPCDSSLLRESTTPAPWLFVVIAPLATVGALFAARRVATSP